MNSKKILIVGTIGAIGYVLLRTLAMKETIKFFSYSISSIKVSFKNILSPQVLFGIKVYNPNKTGIPLQSFLGTIKYGNTVIASFNSTSPIELSGQEEKIVDVTARVNALNIILQIFAGHSSSTVKVDGIIKTTLFEMPISETVDLTTISGTAGVGKMKHQFFRRLPGFRKHRQSFLQYNEQPAATVEGAAF